MIEKIEKIYKREYENLKQILEKKYSWLTPMTEKNNCLQKMLGIAHFIQEFDIEYEELEKLYNKYKVKVEAL